MWTVLSPSSQIPTDGLVDPTSIQCPSRCACSMQTGINAHWWCACVCPLVANHHHVALMPPLIMHWFVFLSGSSWFGLRRRRLTDIIRTFIDPVGGIRVLVSCRRQLCLNTKHSVTVSGVCAQLRDSALVKWSLKLYNALIDAIQESCGWV